MYKDNYCIYRDCKIIFKPKLQNVVLDSSSLSAYWYCKIFTILFLRNGCYKIANNTYVYVETIYEKYVICYIIKLQACDCSANINNSNAWYILELYKVTKNVF